MVVIFKGLSSSYLYSLLSCCVKHIFICEIGDRGGLVMVVKGG